MTKKCVRKLISEKKNKMHRFGKRKIKGYRHTWEKFNRRINKM